MGASAEKETRPTPAFLLECDDPPARLAVPATESACERTTSIASRSLQDKVALRAARSSVAECVARSPGRSVGAHVNDCRICDLPKSDAQSSDAAVDLASGTESLACSRVMSREVSDCSESRGGLSPAMHARQPPSACSSKCPADRDMFEPHRSAPRCIDLATCKHVDCEVVQLRRRLADAEARASRAEEKLWMWESLASQASYIVALGPDRGDSYKRTFMKELTDAIRGVSFVHEVRDLVCSIPAVPSEAPSISLVHWNGDMKDPMEWDVQWSSACWHVGVSVLGRQYGLSWSLKLRMHHFGVRGRLKVLLPAGGALDLSRAVVSFAEQPDVDFSVDSEVVLGVVPLPVQRQVDAQIRAACMQWLSKEMVQPNGMLFKIPSMKPKERLSDKDVEQAILDAEMVRRMHSKSL